jgi:hypothetical protein
LQYEALPVKFISTEGGLEFANATETGLFSRLRKISYKRNGNYSSLKPSFARWRELWRAAFALSNFERRHHFAIAFVEGGLVSRLVRRSFNEGGSAEREGWSQLPDLNRRPTVYKTVALPLS